MIKPDGVTRGLIGKVISRIEKEHLNVLALRMTMISREEAEGFYEVHKGKSFFDALVDFTSSGPIVVLVLEGLDAINRWRNLMGATDPKKADPGTIRADFGDREIIRHNVVHGSDSLESATVEIDYFFKRRDE